MIGSVVAFISADRLGLFMYPANRKNTIKSSTATIERKTIIFQEVIIYTVSMLIRIFIYDIINLSYLFVF